MTAGDDERALHEYIDSLPAGHRGVRDRGGRRQRVVASLAAHAGRERARVRRQRVTRRFAAVAAVAVCAAATWLTVPHKRAAPLAAALPAVTVVDGVLLLVPGTPRTLRAGDSIGLGDVGSLEAPPRQTVRLRVSDVVSITLNPAARVRLAHASDTHRAEPIEAVALERGRAHFDVKKLGGTRRFHVLTPDADVEVRGTSFDVELRPGQTPGTCVSVEEGVVWVESGLQSRVLGRLESFGCDVPGTAPVESATAPSSVPPASSNTSVSVATGSSAGHARDADHGDPSDLRVQNELFQAALAAERAGHLDDAARTYRQLITRAPRGSLSAQARANLAAISPLQR